MSASFFVIHSLSNHSFQIEEVKEKPQYFRAIHFLHSLRTELASGKKVYFKMLNPANGEASIKQIADRVLLGYDQSYFNPSRVGLLKRIWDALSLFFGWEIERNRISKIHQEILASKPVDREKYLFVGDDTTEDVEKIVQQIGLAKENCTFVKSPQELTPDQQSEYKKRHLIVVMPIRVGGRWDSYHKDAITSSSEKLKLPFVTLLIADTKPEVQLPGARLMGEEVFRYTVARRVAVGSGRELKLEKAEELVQDIQRVYKAIIEENSSRFQ